VSGRQSALRTGKDLGTGFDIVFFDCCRTAMRVIPGDLMKHRRRIEDLLTEARARLDRVMPEDLALEHAGGALVVDIRPSEQRCRDGELPGAIVIDRNVLEWRLDPASPHRISDVNGYDQRIIVVCNEGYSSSLAAATLQDLGMYRATDLIGGYQQWSRVSGKTTDLPNG
jgi:rhodanese-related sulfurtransferase